MRDGDGVQIKIGGRLSEWCDLLPLNDLDATIRQLKFELLRQDRPKGGP